MKLPQNISSNKEFCKLEDVSFTHTSSLIGKTIKDVEQTDQGLCWTIYFTDDTYLIIDSGRNTPAMILYPFEPEEPFKRHDGIIDTNVQPNIIFNRSG